MNLLNLLLFFHTALIAGDEPYSPHPAPLLPHSPAFTIAVDPSNQLALENSSKIGEISDVPRYSMLWLVPIVIGLALGFFWKKNQNKYATAFDQDNLNALAVERLQQLRNEKPAIFYSETSLMIRTLLEQRYGIPGLSKTRAELEIELQSLPHEIQQPLLEFFARAEQVQFANHPAHPADYEKEITILLKTGLWTHYS